MTGRRIGLTIGWVVVAGVLAALIAAVSFGDVVTSTVVKATT
jgi:hypothetical protein